MHLTWLANFQVLIQSTVVVVCGCGDSDNRSTLAIERKLQRMRVVVVL
jgi:hypothetical protein